MSPSTINNQSYGNELCQDKKSPAIPVSTNFDMAADDLMDLDSS
jgi:hypothetical protein